jgi:general secretion pathway protein K
MKLLENQNGIALFLVLWVLILLSVIVGEFSHAMRTEVNIARNFRDEAQAYYIAQAGIYQAIFELIKTETKPPQLQGVESDKKQDKTRWRINADIVAENFAEGSFKVKIDNESGKIDINAAGEDMLRMMLAPFNSDSHQKDVIADSVQDWREGGNFHRVNGAKNDYYQSLPEPYSCKNAEFDSIEELLLVRGMTQEIYDGLKEMITVYRGDTYADKRSIFGGGEYTKAAEKKKININAASSEVLRLLPKITEEIIIDNGVKINDPIFNYQYYDNFLKHISSSDRFLIVPLKDFKNTNSVDKVVISLRYDVDFNINSAVKFLMVN